MTAASFVFVGECRSLTAIKNGWTWKDGRLAAKPLFEALRAMGIEPTAQEFVNLFTDPPAKPRVDTTMVALLRATTQVLVAMGARVSRELVRQGIEHVAIVHPAARGRIRKRSRYISHVTKRLKAHR